MTRTCPFVMLFAMLFAAAWLTAFPFAAAWGQRDAPQPGPGGGRGAVAGEGRSMPADPVEAYETDFQPPDPAKVIAGFREAVSKRGGLNDATRAKIETMLDRAAGRDGPNPEVINDALQALHADYQRSVELLAEERSEAASAILENLASSDQPYLAAHARYYLARAHAMRERYEDALPHLQWLTKPGHLDKTLYSGEIMFLKGVAQAETLQREAALATLKDFAVSYPEASERMLIGALHMIDELSYLESGSLGDVQDRMDYSRRRLEIERSDQRTRGEQQRIVRILEKMIEEQEKKEQQQQQGQGQSQGGGQSRGQGGAPQGNQTPGGPADQSDAPEGEGRIGALDRAPGGGDRGDWAQAREKEREQVLNAIKARYPDRYRELIERYYRSLQEGSD